MGFTSSAGLLIGFRRCELIWLRGRLQLLRRLASDGLNATTEEHLLRMKEILVKLQRHKAAMESAKEQLLWNDQVGNVATGGVSHWFFTRIFFVLGRHPLGSHPATGADALRGLAQHRHADEDGAVLVAGLEPAAVGHFRRPQGLPRRRRLGHGNAGSNERRTSILYRYQRR